MFPKLKPALLALSCLLASCQVEVAPGRLPDGTPAALPTAGVTPFPRASAAATPSPTVASATPSPAVSTAAAAPTPVPSVTPVPLPLPNATPVPTPTPVVTPVPTPTPFLILEPGSFSPIRRIAGVLGQTGRAESGTNEDKVVMPTILPALVTDEERNIWMLDRGSGRLAYITKELSRPNTAGNTINYRIFWVKQEKLDNPVSMARDKEGNFYILEQSLNRVIKLTSKGSVELIAGSGTQGYNGDGRANTVHLNRPTDVALDSAGNLYITDTGNHLIRKVTPDGMLTTIAGQYKLNTKTDTKDQQASFEPVGETSGDGGPAAASQVNAPQHIAVDLQGNIYFTSQINYIRYITPQGTVDRFVGTGTDGYNGDNIDAKLAHLNGPGDLAIGPDNLLYFVDSKNRRVRRVERDGKIKDIAGEGRQDEHVDILENPLKAQILPVAITLDAQGDLYIYDGAHRLLRRVERIKK